MHRSALLLAALVASSALAQSTALPGIPAAATQNFVIGDAGVTGNVEVGGEARVQGRGMFAFIDFDAGIATPTQVEGRVWWDLTASKKTLTVDTAQDGVRIHVGEEVMLRYRNSTGVSITAPQALYVSGTHAGDAVPEMSLAKADALATAEAVCLAEHTCPNNSTCYCQALGHIDGLDTSAFVNGDLLYLSASSAGALTATRPSQPNFTKPLAVVTKAAASAAGKLLVNVGSIRFGAYTAKRVAFGGSDGFIKESDGLTYDSTSRTLTTYVLDGGLANFSGSQVSLADYTYLLWNATTGLGTGYVGLVPAGAVTGSSQTTAALNSIGDLVVGQAASPSSGYGNLQVNGYSIARGALFADAGVISSTGVMTDPREGSASLNFASIGTATCADLTITVTGAAQDDVCALGIPNAAVVTGSQFTCRFSAANTATVRHCCINGLTVGTCDPGAGTFKARRL